MYMGSRDLFSVRWMAEAYLREFETSNDPLDREFVLLMLDDMLRLSHHRVESLDGCVLGARVAGRFNFEPNNLTGLLLEGFSYALVESGTPSLDHVRKKELGRLAKCALRQQIVPGNLKNLSAKSGALGGFPFGVRNSDIQIDVHTHVHSALARMVRAKL